MAKILRFSIVSLRDLAVTAGPALLVAALACFIAYRLIDPTPPRKVTISTGQENSAYEQFAKKYAAALARKGITLELKPSLGSQENLQRLQQPASGIDIAFVRSGSIEPEQAENAGLVSLGSLFTEPVWLFLRDSPATRRVARIADLKGLRINIGAEGSGVPQLFERILDANGLAPQDLTLGTLGDTPATVELLEGRIDGLVFSSAPDALLIQMLLRTPGMRLFDFAQSDAYTRRFPFLTRVVLPRGIVDLERDLPPRDYQLIAPTATLVAREDLHPALIDLLVQAASEIHGRAGWFARQDEFPTPDYNEIPVARDAEKFYRNGPPLLQRYMPFWLANILDRMWVVIVALGALLIPLSRIVPPLYVWKVRSRVYRWYGQLRTVEHEVEDVPPEKRAQVYAEQLRKLDEIESRVNHISIPLSFAEELYGLRSHINFVRKRINWLMSAPQGGE